MGNIEKLNISDCKVANESNRITFDTVASYAGGVIGYSCAEQTKVNNNNVRNLSINDRDAQMSSIGGLIGGVLRQSYAEIKYVECNGNTVDELLIETKELDDGACAGLVGHIMPGFSPGQGIENTVAELKNNIVKSSRIVNTSTKGGGDVQLAGIVGTVCKIEQCNVINCKVIDTDIIDNTVAWGSAGCINGSFIIGWASGTSIQLRDCDVYSTRENKSELFIANITDGRTSPVGGFIGAVQNNENSNYRII